MKAIDDNIKKAVVRFQRSEITEHHIYKRLSLAVKGNNRTVLERISAEELNHYNVWKGYSGEEVKHDTVKYWLYVAISTVFGVTFGIKLMEKDENKARILYKNIAEAIPEAMDIEKQEDEHESRLVEMIDEERLKYMGSVVLGLNDALVEFTGALAGFTFAMRNSRLVGMAGLIMGLSASLSMAASEYLSTKTEAADRHPLKASLYTGVAYAITVSALIFPYFVFQNIYLCLALTIIFAVTLILVFSFYSSVVKEISFRGRFTEMLAISMGVAVLSFVIGLLAREFLKVDI